MSNLLTSYYSNLNDLQSIQSTDINSETINTKSLVVNGVQITTNGASYPSITYNSTTNTTAISGFTTIANLNGFLRLNLDNAILNSYTLTSNAQDQLTLLQTKTQNMTVAGTQTNFTGTVSLNSAVTLVTNRTMTTNGSISFGTNGTIQSNGQTLTNIQIGYLGGLTASVENRLSTAITKLTNQTYNSTLNRTAISGILLAENLNISGTVNTRQINVGTDVSPSLLQLFGDLLLPLNSTITANGVIISSTELSFLDNCSSNIQNQFSNINTSISNIQDDITDINSHLTSLDAGLSAVGIVAGGAATAAAAAQATASAAVAQNVIQDGILTSHTSNLGTLNTKTTRQDYLPAGSGQPDRTVFNSDLVANRVRTNDILPDAGSNIAFNVIGTSTFSGSVSVQGSLSTTLASTFNGASTFNNTATLNGAVGINAVTSFNGKSTTFYEEIPAYPASAKAIVYFYQPTIFYKQLEVNENIVMLDTKTFFTNKIVANPVLIGVDELVINSGIAVGTENLKIRSNMSLDSLYTFTNNGELITGDSTQATNKRFTSYGEFALKSAITFYENITSAYKDATIYATKTAGATADWVGLLNIWCRNLVYTNINNVYYRTSTASGFYDVTTTIASVFAYQNGGSYKTTSYSHDLEATIVYLGNDDNSVTNVRGVISQW